LFLGCWFVPSDAFFDELLAANAIYAARFLLHGRPTDPSRQLAVLTCMDARLDPLAMLGLERGDAVILRNAGARATEDAVRSLVLASALLGVKRLMLIGHTRCRLTAKNDDIIRAAVRDAGGPDTSDIAFLAAAEAAAAVRDDVAKLPLVALSQAASRCRLSVRHRHRQARSDQLAGAAADRT
jgi:carbonic anhydrase